MQATPRKRDEGPLEDEVRDTKRLKLDVEHPPQAEGTEGTEEIPEDGKPQYIFEDLLPPSRSLIFPAALPTPTDDAYRVMEVDVGIAEYIDKDVRAIQGIIKQRCEMFRQF